MAEQWFETWFDTNYYHLLYRNRDENEARQFIDALLRYLSPKVDQEFLDIACGKGRHAIYLHERGYCVTGVDLSANSISIANESTEEGLYFFVRDIRHPLGVRSVDFALNMFTSFGYFDTEEEHVNALMNIKNAVVPNGTFVMDYLNLDFVKSKLIEEEVQVHDGIEYRINREIKDGFIHKSIKVIDGEQEFDFIEKVKAFNSENLISMVEKAGFEVIDTFGDYNLNPLNQDSTRVILIASNSE